MAALEQLTTKDLLFPFKDSFHSKVDADSLIDAMGRNKMLKKRDIKYLKGADERAMMSFVFNKLYGADKSTTPDHVIELFVKTGNEQNVQFSKQLRSKLSLLQRPATIDTTSVTPVLPTGEDVSGAQTAQVLTTPSLPPFKYHYPLDDNATAIFSSAGGVLYSPVYGVTVYIPAGAILGEEQVEVSFRLVKEEAEIQELLSHPLFKGSVICSGLFELKAKLVNVPDGEEFTQFHSDVWIELPHCLSFGGYSLKDYSAAFVVSERRGKVEVEEQALFSDGYPYVNLPVRHFSRFCVPHTPKKRFTATPNAKKAMQKLCISNSFDEKHSASPHVRSQLLKQKSREAATPSTAAEKRALFYEMEKTSSEASAEEHRQMLVRQDASENLDAEETMEVDPPAQVGTAFYTPLQQELLNAVSMSVMARVYQPRKRHKMRHWTADIVFAPHLHNAYKTLADCQEQCQFECCTTVFHMELRNLLIQLRSGPSTQEWSVELSTTKILLEQLEKVAPLLSSESGYSSKMADFLPKCTAAVQNHMTFLPLRHPIEVEKADPPARCYLTCEPALDKVGANDQTPHCSQRYAQHDPSPSGSTQGPSHSVSTQDPRPSDSTQGPRPSDSTQGPRPSDSTQGPRSSDSTQGPCPSDSTQGPRPSDSTQGPGPFDSTQCLGSSDSTQGPRPLDSKQGPGPSDSTHGPDPFDSTQGPGPSDSTQGPRPSDSTQGPRPSDSTQGPRPSDSTQGPGPFDSTQGLGSSDSTQGPRPLDSKQGPGPSDSTHGPDPFDSTHGPGPSDSTQGPGPSDSTHGPGPFDSTQGPGPSDSTQSPSPSDYTHGPSPSSSTVTGSTPSSFPSAPFSPQQKAVIQWVRDHYILALLSIMIPQDHLAALGESLSLPRLTIDQVLSSYTAGSTNSVGEGAYEMFKCASKSEQPLTFGKIFVTLDEINRSDDLVPILRSYLQSFKMATSGTPLEGDDSIQNLFFVWLHVNHPTLIPPCGIEEKRTISPGHSEQGSLFLYLSPKLVCVWRMVGRLLGLTDSDIEAIGAAHNSQQDRESEPCYQMLLRWVEHSRRPSNMTCTYYRLMAALQLTSRHKGAANDAIFYLRNFVLNLNSAIN